MPEVTNKYIRIPVKKKLSSDKIRTISISATQGIKALYSINRKLILTYLFLRSKGWTMAKAKKWVKGHSKNKSMKKTQLIKKTKDTIEKEMARFSFTMPILKCYEEVQLNEEGKEIKKRFIEGAASSTDVDLQGDQMAPSAIKSMANSIKQHIIGLNAEHDKSWQSELGEVSKLSIDKKNRLIMKALLDITSKANDLWYALTVKKKELGLSVGGFVKDYIIEWDKKKEKFKRIFKEIELDHIAVTSTPANPKTWVGAISKSINKVERQNDFNSLKDMPKKALIKFIEKTLKAILGEDNLKTILTNFSLNFNKRKIMTIKKKDALLESEEAKKKALAKTKKEEAEKDASELEDEEDSENPDNKAADDDEDDNSDEDDASEDDESKEDDSEEEESDEESADEADAPEKDDSESDEDSEDSEDSEEGEESDEEESEDEDEEKALTRKEVSDMIEKGISEGVKNFFKTLFGKKAEKTETKEPKDKDAKKSENDAVDLLKSIIKRQDSIEKTLKKQASNRKTTKSVAIDKNNEEGSKEEEGVYKTLEDELVAVRKQHINDSEKAFSECGKVRKKWAEKEQ